MTAELLRLIAASVCLHAAMTGTRLAAPLLALERGHSAAAVGLLLALFALTQVFLALPAGRYTDRRGLKRPVAIAVVAATAGGVLAALHPAFWMLCLAALLTGGASGIAMIALQRHVGRAAANAAQLRQVFSWLGIAPAVSNFIGPFGAGLLMGFRVAFAVLALLPLAGWLLVRSARELPLAPPAPGVKLRAWDLLRAPMLRRLLFVNWLQSCSWDVHTFVVPILGHQRGLSAAAIGGVLGAFALAAASIRVLLPLAAARLSERDVITAATLLTVGVFAVYPLTRSAQAMGACAVALGLALGAVQPMVMSMLHQITPHERQGEALALRVMTLNASSFAMPMLFGVAGSVLGVASVFWIVGGVVALGLRAVRRLQAPPAA